MYFFLYTYKQYGTKPKQWHATDFPPKVRVVRGSTYFRGPVQAVEIFVLPRCHVVDWICMYLTLAKSDHQGSSFFFLNVGDPYKHYHLPLGYWEAEHLNIQKYVYQVWIPKFTILVTLYIHYVHKHYINLSTSFFKDHFRTILVGNASWFPEVFQVPRYTSILHYWGCIPICKL